MKEREIVMIRSETLESIPGVGREISKKLTSIGIRKVSDLKNRDPEELYKRLEERTGLHMDRCLLYVFRAAVYYASHTKHDPEKLKWWNWKDKTRGITERSK
jgi:hypothetical protein